MELEFLFLDGWWVSEFSATSDFNLHIEKDKGDIYLYQRTGGQEFDFIKDFGFKKGGDNVIDVDFSALVYPKFIKIKSKVKPLICTITTDGEVNELVYQEKTVEITSNGTTKVTADTGYNGLAQVNVKVNVEGGSGGSTDSGELKRNDVNFFDYDGTLLYSYSWDEAKELGELPVAPSHDGMTFKEWNYTLEDIKAQGTDIIKGKADVGAVFVDGSGTQVESPNNVLIFPRGTEEISSGRGNQFLSVVSIPNTVYMLGESAFYMSYIDYLVIPISVTETDKGYGSVFRCRLGGFWRNGKDLVWDKDICGCTFPSTFEVPPTYSSIAVLSNENVVCSEIVFPSTITHIDVIEYEYKPVAVLLNFTKCEQVVTLGSSFINYPRIIVPSRLYNEWKKATNWSEKANEIIKDSDYTYFNKKG